MSRLSKLKRQIILEANIKLSEQAAVANKAATPATPATPNNTSLVNDYSTVLKSVWYDIRNNIVFGGNVIGKSNGVMQWKYPTGTKEQPTQLHKPDGSIVDQAILDNYNKMFNDKLKLAVNDNTWLEPIATSANEKNTNKQQNINFQTYIMNNIVNKNLVRNNGTEGKAFNDGTFYIVTLKALINYRLEQNYKDTDWMIKQLGGI